MDAILVARFNDEAENGMHVGDNRSAVRQESAFDPCNRNIHGHRIAVRKHDSPGDANRFGGLGRCLCKSSDRKQDGEDGDDGPN